MLFLSVSTCAREPLITFIYFPLFIFCGRHAGCCLARGLRMLLTQFRPSAVCVDISSRMIASTPRQSYVTSSQFFS